MTKWDIGLAKEFKNRENPDYIGATIGTVTSVSPLTISIYGGAGIFSGSILAISKACTEYTMQVTTPSGNGTALHEGLKLNDKVICIADESNQRLYAIEKVGS
jgi:Protein of unknown function (DUF2577).